MKKKLVYMCIIVISIPIFVTWMMYIHRHGPFVGINFFGTLAPNPKVAQGRDAQSSGNTKQYNILLTPFLVKEKWYGHRLSATWPQKCCICNSHPGLLAVMRKDDNFQWMLHGELESRKNYSCDDSFVFIPSVLSQTGHSNVGTRKPEDTHTQW